MPDKLPLKPLADLSEIIGDGHVDAFSLAQDGRVCLAFRTDLGKQFRAVHQEEEYRAVFWSEQEVQSIQLPPQVMPCHFVQPLCEEKILVVAARARHLGDDKGELNARVYTREGHLLREFCMGDGIEDVQVDETGSAWTSYFDEGIYGNYGWRRPIGEPGLLRWDTESGAIVEKFTDQLGFISDCYALNVKSSREVWLCYYMGFPLICLRSGVVAHSLKVPVRGSHFFAIGRNQALFGSGYDDPWNRLTLISWETGSKSADVERVFEIEVDDGIAPDQRRTVHARGPFIIMLIGTKLYRLDVREMDRN